MTVTARNGASAAGRDQRLPRKTAGCRGFEHVERYRGVARSVSSAGNVGWRRDARISLRSGELQNAARSAREPSRRGCGEVVERRQPLVEP